LRESAGAPAGPAGKRVEVVAAPRRLRGDAALPDPWVQRGPTRAAAP